MMRNRLLVGSKFREIMGVKALSKWVSERIGGDEMVKLSMDFLPRGLLIKDKKGNGEVARRRVG